MAGTSSASAAWPFTDSSLRLVSSSSLSTAFQGASMAGLASLVQLLPLGLAGVGMLSEQNTVHRPGSFDAGTWAYRATWKMPFGPHSPNSVPALVLFSVTAKPALFHWL